jgi:O-antigen/teichoic acid export membrane protein
MVFFRNDAAIIDLTLDMRSKVLLGALAAAISAALAYLFIPTLGALGLCIGLLVGRSILTVSYPLLVMRRFGIKGGGDLGTVLWRSLLSLLVIGAASYLGAAYQTGSWVELFVYAGATCGVLSVIVVMLGLTGDERRQMLRRVRSLRAR